MQDLNSVNLIGRLTKSVVDDEKAFGYLQNGTAKAEFSIAVNGRGKKNPDGSYTEDVSYFQITLFGSPAESLKAYLVKGQQVAVKGILKQDRWQDKNGNNQSKVHIIADSVQLIGGKKDNAPNEKTVFNSVQAAQSSFAQEYQKQEAQENLGFVEDIPF